MATMLIDQQALAEIERALRNARNTLKVVESEIGFVMDKLNTFVIELDCEEEEDGE